MKIEIADYIRDIPDFPKEGILFKDISPLLENPQAFKESVRQLASQIDKVDHIVGLDARGFIFGAAVAYELGLPFSMIRKSGKLPYTTFIQSYDLEYGSNEFELHIDSIKAGSKVAIIDDLLATGGSASAAVKLVEKSGAIVDSFHFVIELSFLKGRDLLTKGEVNSLIVY